MIKTKKITPAVLVKTAKDLIKKRYHKEGHHTVVAAALLTKSGNVYTGLNVGTNQPSIATCAEIITIGAALTAEKDFEIDMIVAVRGANPYVVSPCGKCREYIADYGPDARVIMPVNEARDYEVVPIADLLPNKYCKVMGFECK